MSPDRPTLYWISGSPPAWRVMLAFVIKGVAFDARRLDHGAGENRDPAYLALNPKGQVPTIVAGDIVLRESLAIMAWLDRAFPDQPIWGRDHRAAAAIWQDVMVMEGDLRPAVTAAAQGLIRGRPVPTESVDVLEREADHLDARLASTAFLGGERPMASDIWLYPALRWIGRGVALSSDPPKTLRDLVNARPALAAWDARLTAIPGVASTHPPHWEDK
ncbi:glutathione S-transferase family protein [Cognatiyoonia sp. IB215182]|uniref:glutathione S-transferase family protein n=1 Tax=Cognatiyoonia sp. IB215182 TaxID=3097353 RepID=UPI002A0F4B99|nr:glutathione S-transferase family protein [Cognatiyoonia sp. IB215182]MDX8354022.1 glutathione S-transferase family protein [Cognatiyoonia sp. IB215182]